MEHYYKSIQGWFEDGPVHRDAIRKYDNAHFVEVGCWRGRSTSFLGVEIINSGKKIVLDVVDTFAGSAEHAGVDGTELFDSFIKNIEPIRSVMGTVHRNYSLEASKFYSDRSLDFVFIDASHDYANVVADIEAWYPKVRIGGMLSGDDFCPGHWDGVVRAAYDFSQIGKKTLCIQGQHWYVTKVA